MKRYRAVLCGLGNIAWRFDRHLRKSGTALSHADAYRRQPRTLLSAGFSPDKEDREAFSRELGLAAYQSLEELLANEKPDIVSICSPSGAHYEQVMTCLSHGVPMIWLEKPPALTLTEVDGLLASAAAAGSTVAVNYQRRYLPIYQAFRNRFLTRELGRCRRITATYSRGLETNGSHILDMLFFVAGDGGGHRMQWVSNAGDSDNPSFGLTIGGIEAVVTGADLPYHDIDIAITCDGGRFSVLHGGMTARVEERVEHELFPGFHRLRELEDRDFSRLAGLGGGMENALADLLEAHDGGRAPISGLYSSRKTMALVGEVRRRQSGGEKR